jgi:hypothetical protein
LYEALNIERGPFTIENTILNAFPGGIIEGKLFLPTDSEGGGGGGMWFVYFNGCPAVEKKG